MGSTFLNLTNDLLSHFNEVQLDSTTFSNAVGFQTVCQDAVNEAIRQIEQAEHEWPFNWNETTKVLTGTVSAYDFPTTTLDTAEKIDWQSFILKRDDTLDPKVSEKKIDYISWDEYLDRYAIQDANRTTGDSSIREPSFVTWKQEANKYIVYPTPDRAYTIYFEWWSFRDNLSAHSDTTRIPTRFDHVIKKLGLSECYHFRGDDTRSAMYQRKGETGIKNMRSLLINRDNKVRDGRVSTGTG